MNPNTYVITAPQPSPEVIGPLLRYKDMHLAVSGTGRDLVFHFPLPDEAQRAFDAITEHQLTSTSTPNTEINNEEGK